MIIGITCAITSGFLWGLIFIGPLLIPEYPSILQAAARYITFGLISLLLSWYNRKCLYRLLLTDWLEAIKLVIAGHLIYYTCVASAIQRIGAPITTSIIGTLPVILIIGTYICENTTQQYNKNLSNHVIIKSTILIVLGLVCINIAELRYESFNYNFWEYIIGIILAIISVICWTWYALRNTRWLKTHPHNKPVTWANAQGIVILPLSCITYCIICIYLHYMKNEFILPFGPRPIFFIFLMIFIGLCCSWLGTLFWNAATQRLPTTLVGPLIIFETVAGLIYTFIHRKLWPSSLIFIGIFLLISGVLYIFYKQYKFNTD